MCRLLAVPAAPLSHSGCVALMRLFQSTISSFHLGRTAIYNPRIIPYLLPLMRVNAIARMVDGILLTIREHPSYKLCCIRALCAIYHTWAGLPSFEIRARQKLLVNISCGPQPTLK